MFSLHNEKYNVVNECWARPKNPESCRGDAPRAAIFDEVAFIGKKLWSDFAFPLLQVKDRIFTLATTPPAPSSWFSQFVDQIKERNKNNDFFFNLINHSLSCAVCLEAGEAVDCCHNLMYVPPWKSMVTLNQMLNLASDKEAYQMEVYGILAAGGPSTSQPSLLTRHCSGPKCLARLLPTFCGSALTPHRTEFPTLQARHFC